MLFDFLYEDKTISVVLSKITGIIDSSGISATRTTICVEGDPDGYRSTESYSVILARLCAALEAAEAKKTGCVCPQRKDGESAKIVQQLKAELATLANDLFARYSARNHTPSW